MKTALFAAAMLFAAPAFAQTTGGTGSGTPVGADAKASTATGQTSTDAQTTTPPMSSSDSTMSSQSSMPMSGQSSMGDQGSMGGSGTMTAGGYQPSTPMPMASGGQQPVFQPGQSVAQAYPAPAPLASYPICKKGQYDKCMQRGGR